MLSPNPYIPADAPWEVPAITLAAFERARAERARRANPDNHDLPDRMPEDAGRIPNALGGYGRCQFVLHTTVIPWVEKAPPDPEFVRLCEEADAAPMQVDERGKIRPSFVFRDGTYYRCSKCGAWRIEDEFGINRHCRGGRGSWCRVCHRAVVRTNNMASSARRRNAKARGGR